jgi:hypothetical protein
MLTTGDRRRNMKILMVLTSHDTLGNTGLKTRFWLEENPASSTVAAQNLIALLAAAEKAA